MRLVGCVLNGTEFMGQPTRSTPVVYLTEERDATFRAALERAGISNATDLHTLMWRDTLGVSWEEIVDGAVQKCREVGARLLVVDTVSQFAQLAGDAENNAGDVLKTYRPLQAAAGEGIAVLSVRHERKSGGDVANAGRGSSAFTGAADIVLAIRRPEGGNADPAVRHILALSRFDETPDLTTIELTDTGYVAHGTSTAVTKRKAKTALMELAPTSDREALSLEELAERAGFHRTTAQDAVKELISEGKLQPLGKGVKGDRRRYFASQIHSAGTPSFSAAETMGLPTAGEPVLVTEE
jgi:hypothetical protein